MAVGRPKKITMIAVSSLGRLNRLAIRNAIKGITTNRIRLIENKLKYWLCNSLIFNAPPTVNRPKGRLIFANT